MSFEHTFAALVEITVEGEIIGVFPIVQNDTEHSSVLRALEPLLRSQTHVCDDEDYHELRSHNFARQVSDHG